jgi:glycine cleavage system H protein
VNVPAELKYAKSHEWVKVDGGVATIGITEYAQGELGDVVYVDLPEVGKKLAVGDTFGTVESVKTVSDVYAPVAGEVVEVNGNLANQSELVNSEPFTGGWMIKIKLSNPADVNALMDAAAYQGSIEA